MVQNQLTTGGGVEITFEESDFSQNDAEKVRAKTREYPRHYGSRAAAIRNLGSLRFEKKIPAFAGMTASCLGGMAVSDRLPRSSGIQLPRQQHHAEHRQQHRGQAETPTLPRQRFVRCLGGPVRRTARSSPGISPLSLYVFRFHAARTANAEAIPHGERALKLLAELPETPQQRRTELDLLLTLSQCRVAVLGYGHSEVENALIRANELRTRVDDPALLTKALAKLWMMHLVQADYGTALQLAEQLRALAKKININLLEAAGSAILGWTHWPLGQLTQARECLDYALSLHDEESSKATIAHYGTDGISVASVASSAVLWLLGFPEQALQRAREATARAETLGHAYTRSC